VIGGENTDCQAERRVLVKTFNYILRGLLGEMTKSKHAFTFNRFYRLYRDEKTNKFRIYGIALGSIVSTFYCFPCRTKNHLHHSRPF